MSRWSRGVAWSNTLPCQGRDRGFESRRLRINLKAPLMRGFLLLALMNFSVEDLCLAGAGRYLIHNTTTVENTFEKEDCSMIRLFSQDDTYLFVSRKT